MSIIFFKGDVMKIYSKWKDSQVVELFRFVEQGKSQNVCLTKLFESYAKKSGRMPNSVRNYYYNELENLLSNEKRAKKLGIDVNLHQKNNSKEFSCEETKDLVISILKNTAKGMSVRKACLSLADGDINLMVRYQNKFRSVVVKDKELYDSCVKEIYGQTEKFDTKPKNNNMPNNVVKFKQRQQFLTDSDINSLFLGLVKLVKKQAGEEMNKDLKLENKKANSMLRKTLVELSEKENEIKNLRKNFKVLSDSNQKLKEELKVIRGKNAELLSKIQKSTI